MNTLRLIVCVYSLLVAASVAGQEKPNTPAPVDDVLLAQPFSLSNGYKHRWSRNGPLVKSGTLFVLKVAPALVVPRNEPEPILYAGDMTVQRLNRGDESGHVIGIIPGEINLVDTPIWFGQPGLPERVTETSIRDQRALADQADIKPLTAEKVQDVTRERLEAENLSTLLREHVAELLMEYSPQEMELARKWRLPVARARPKPR